MLEEVHDFQAMYTAISLLRLKNTTTPLDQTISEAVSEAMSAATILINQRLSSDEVQDSQTEAIQAMSKAATQATQATQAMSEAATNAATILLKMKNQRLSLDKVQDEVQDSQTEATQATQAMSEAAAILMKMKNPRF